MRCLVVIVDIRLALLGFEALEDTALYADMEVPFGTVAERNPVKAHFPAVQVAAETDGGNREFLSLHIESGAEIYIEFVGNLYIAR